MLTLFKNSTRGAANLNSRGVKPPSATVKQNMPIYHDMRHIAYI